MVRFSSVFIKKIFLTLFILILSGVCFGQSLRQDLGKSFKNFKLTRLDNARLSPEQTNSSLTISTDQKTYILDIKPNDLRAPQYRAEVETSNGKQSLTAQSVTTFRGKVAGETDSEVRLTINGETVEGYFSTQAGKFFIEAAKKYSELAESADLIIYREEDFINPEQFSCGSQLVEKINRGSKMVESQSSAVSSNSLRVLEIATESDYEFTTRWGNANQANAEILSILNMVEGVYEREIGLTFEVVYQHAWATPDPFNGINADTMVRSFQAYWNQNQTNISRDVAHIWTAKPNVMAQGYAFLNVICVNPSATYGMSGFVEWVPAKYDVTAHEIGHNLGANHADAPQGCADTIMNSVLTAVTPLTFCSFSRSEISNYITTNSSCLSPRSSSKTRFDFDGDGKADTVVFRPTNGNWYVLKSSSGNFEGYQFGANGDKPVPADYDGDGKTDAAVFRNGNWYFIKSSTGTFNSTAFGLSTDLPAPSDFDGDGKTDVAVFRPATGYWFILNSNSGSFTATQFGANGDIPIPSDFDGDNKSDVTVWRPSNGAWYRLNSSNNAFFTVQFGANGDKPVSGDFDGDNKADIAVFRPSNGNWYLIYSGNEAFYSLAFGLSTDIPSPGDFNGDGKTDIGVFRNGVWHRFIISQSAYSAVQFGTNGDIPAQSFYIQ